MMSNKKEKIVDLKPQYHDLWNHTRSNKASSIVMMMMMMKLQAVAALLVSVIGLSVNAIITAEDAAAPLSPSSWDDLDKRPLANWYPKAKFGIFIHWGVFSVPSFGSEWFESYWIDDKSAHGDKYRAFVNATERPNFAYADYAHRFTAHLYKPNDWADIFAKAGAQYVVLTSKHHEGFCNWDSRNIPTTWNWNCMDIGPRRDLVGELATAIKSTTSPHTQRPIKFGLYHSLYEWFNPLYQLDKQNNFTTQHFVDTKTMAELYDLVDKYEPELIWSDGEWEAPSSYWKSTEFLNWYATKSTVAKTAVWNDRWGQDTLCHHGAFLTCTDRYNPGKYDKNATKKWENALTIDKTSWGLNRNASYTDYLTPREVIHNLIQVVAWNGNMLLNVGPAADGTIHPIFVDRLHALGDWLRVNGKAIYDTEPWQVCQNETAVGVYYTRTSKTLYAHITKWPKGNLLSLQCPQPSVETQISMLGVVEKQQQDETETTSTSTISWSFMTKQDSSHQSGDDNIMATTKRNLLHGTSRNEINDDDPPQAGIVIQLPALTPDVIPSQHAWVLDLSHIANLE